MKSSDLIRWGGLAAAIAGVLLMIINLITLLVILNLGQQSPEMLVRSLISPIAGTLVVLGVLAMYIRQAEAIDNIGLIGFLFALFGTILVLAGDVWANLLAYLGWALFGVSSWQARVYPPLASVLLVVGALIIAPFSSLALGGSNNILAYVGVAASTVFNVALIWLGITLFTESDPSEE